MKRLRPIILVGLVATIGPASPALANSEELPLPDDTYLEHDFSWTDSDESPSDFDSAMARGDRHAIRAAELVPGYGRTMNPSSSRRRQARYAATAYSEAATLAPEDPEPHFRAATVLYGHLLANRGAYIDEGIARRVIHHWDEFARLAPGDPRIRTFLFERALTHTKLAKPADLDRAIADYRHLDRLTSNTSFYRADAANRMANTAEVHMMRGDLARAIPLYERALEIEPSFSHAAGLAVALDRDRQGVKAREIMRAYASAHALESYRADINSGNTFYVPGAEAQYYFGLIFEALGQPDKAIAAYESFILSGAHPRYHTRARENVADLTAAGKPGRRRKARAR